MAAYAALVSVMHIIEQIQHHPRPPISLDKTQVESLTENVAFLQDFLERYPHDGSEETDELESRIRDAAYTAEDVIEIHIVDQISGDNFSCIDLYHDLQIVIEEICFIKKEVMDIIEQIQQHPRIPFSYLYNKQVKSVAESLAESFVMLEDFIERYTDGGEEANRRRDAAYAAEDVIESEIVDQMDGGSTSSHAEKFSSDDLYHDLQKMIQEMSFVMKEFMDDKNTMAGVDDILLEVMDKLTGGQLDRQIIPIYGMGGIGKTTLARNIFLHETIVQHFDILAWATISQEYSVREILLEIIGQENKEYGEHLSECELGEVLHKRLSGRKYLIVMDDMWVIDVWGKVNRFFPNNKNGSRILITTRLSNVALQLNETHGLKMNFLNEDESWNLLCKNIFGEEGCPLELEEMGRTIAKNCKGLPLSIVVIGRVLAKSGQTQEYWKYIAENLSSIVNLEDDEHCLKILSTSYNQLPVHLKPCFLYMGIYEEDHWIRVSSLIKLWVAEGFLKPIREKSLEEIAEEYLMDLIDRNLIFIHERGSNGKIKSCNIHDLLRDLCLRQAQREKFICVTSQCNPNIPQGISTQRRIAVRRSTSLQALQSLQSMSLVRSLIYDFHVDRTSVDFRLFRVLRVLTASNMNFDLVNTKFIESLEDIFPQLINSRYLAISIYKFWTPQLLPSSLYLLWNVHTLIFDHMEDFIAPFEIWKMPQLRHVEFWSLILPNPHIDGRDEVVLRNLQTLLTIKNFRCCEEVVKKIPNIKKLKVLYDGIEGWSLSCFDNLHHLKLETLYCNFLSFFETRWSSDLLQNLTFPHSLKKLALNGCSLHWEDITTKIGFLPLLQVLKLSDNATRGHKWETVEGGFLKLKFLQICSDMECWISESTHFPALEHLCLVGLTNLEEIPLELGDIPTLKSIRVSLCSDSAVFSAKEILDEQEQLGNVDLQVQVRLRNHNEELESFKSRNFQVLS